MRDWSVSSLLTPCHRPFWSTFKMKSSHRCWILSESPRLLPQHDTGPYLKRTLRSPRLPVWRCITGCSGSELHRSFCSSLINVSALQLPQGKRNEKRSWTLNSLKKLNLLRSPADSTRIFPARRHSASCWVKRVWNLQEY